MIKVLFIGGSHHGEISDFPVLRYADLTNEVSFSVIANRDDKLLNFDSHGIYQTEAYLLQKLAIPVPVRRYAQVFAYVLKGTSKESVNNYLSEEGTIKNLKKTGVQFPNSNGIWNETIQKPGCVSGDMWVRW